MEAYDAGQLFWRKQIQEMEEMGTDAKDIKWRFYNAYLN
jgi:hypothetical protein